jgi:hemoglobin
MIDVMRHPDRRPRRGPGSLGTGPCAWLEPAAALERERATAYRTGIVCSGGTTVDGARSTQTAFDVIGGQEGVDRLVETFYRNMDALPQARAIRAMHAADLGPTKTILKLYLAEWLGGPNAYSERRGHPRLRMRHMGFPIGPDERDAWMACMSGALDATVEDARLREALKLHFAKLADWLRNDPRSAAEQRR